MKYVIYIALVLFQLVRKTVGMVWYFVAVPFRRYARNTVYNYALYNGIFLKRLLDRPIHENRQQYTIMPHHGANGGYIKKRHVSKLEYFLVFWLLWGWLDDDSNEDTFSWGRVEGLRKESKIAKYLLRNCTKPYYGNSFDLGDRRADYPAFHFWASWLWTTRNTAYNFKYVLHSKPLDYKYAFMIEWNGYKFGWDDRGDELRWVFFLNSKKGN